MQGGSNGDAFEDLLSGFSMPAPQQRSTSNPGKGTDIFDLFGPTPPQLSANRAPAGHGSHLPGAQQIPGSRASSVAYEDARSHGFTPETTASLLDFDTPFASPTSPIVHQTGQPGPSHLRHSAAGDALAAQHPFLPAGHDPFSGSSQTQLVPSVPADWNRSLGHESPDLLSSQHREQPTPDSASFAIPTLAEMRRHDSSMGHGPVARVRESGRPTPQGKEASEQLSSKHDEPVHAETTLQDSSSMERNLVAHPGTSDKPTLGMAGHEPSGHPSFQAIEQPAKASNSYPGPSHEEMHLHDSSPAHGPVVQLGDFGELTLDGAGSGLSLSDGGASASVLSSLGEASAFDADFEEGADAEELDVTGKAGEHLLQSPVADLGETSDLSADTEHDADAAELGISGQAGQHLLQSAVPDLSETVSPAGASTPLPTRQSIPSSPFQDEPAPGLPGSEAAHSSQLPSEELPGHMSDASKLPAQALQQRLSKQSEQRSEAGIAGTMPGREPRPIQAASSDLMEAWNEQEQLEKQSNAASQLHSRLSLEDSDLALDDLAELKQASSMIDSMVESSDLEPHQQHSFGSAPRLFFESLHQKNERDPSHVHTLQSLPSQDTEQGNAAEPAQQDELQDAGVALHSKTEQHHSTADVIKASEIAAAPDLGSMHPERESRTAEQFLSASARLQADTTILPASAPPSEVPSHTSANEPLPATGPDQSAEALSHRPADDALEEQHEPRTPAAGQQSSSNPNLGYGSSDRLQLAGSLEQSLRHQHQASSEQPQMAELDAPSGEASDLASSGVYYCPGQQSERGIGGTSEHVTRAVGAASDQRDSEPTFVAEHDMAVSEQDVLQHSHMPLEEPNAATPAGDSMPESMTSPEDAAQAGPGADRLAYAEALERALATGSQSEVTAQPSFDPLLGVRQKLAPAGADWPPGGGQGPRGSTVGGSLCMRIDSIAALQQAATNYRTHGAARVVACFHGVVALGMSGGAAFVLLPRGLSAEGGPEKAALRWVLLLTLLQLVLPARKPAATNSHMHGAACVAACFHGVVALGMSGGAASALLPRGLSAEGGPEVMKLGEPRAGDEAAVSALAFSPLGNILAVGHANGDIAFWELRRSGWECGKVVKDAHVTTVVACTFLEASSSTERSMALSSDSRGRLVFHNVTGYLSITNFLAGRLAKSTQQVVLLDGRQLGPLCHLAALHLPPKSNAKAPPDDAARQLFFQDGGSPLDSLVLMGTAKGAYIGRVLPEGRLILLHNIPRPPDTPQGCLPYAAWRACPQPTQIKRIGAAVALGWGQHVLLLDVPLARPNEDPAADGQAAADSASQQAAVIPTVMQSWKLDCPVVGLAWLEGPSLAVIQEQGTRTLIHLYNQQGTQVLERLELDDSLIPNQHLASPGSSELSYTSSLASAPERMMLLTTQGVRAARLMTWQERLATLRDMGRWDHALLMGLSLLSAAQAPANQDASQALTLRGGCLGGRGADPQAIGDALRTLVLRYLDASLPGSREEEVANVAETSVDICLGLGRNSLLWEDVVPRFEQAEALGALLDCLLPRIMSGQLQSLAPEVMQALVEQCVAAGKVADVERCVLRLDLATVDFNQVTRLCRMHQLHSALAFLFTRALSDYAAPAAELLLAHAHSPPDSQGGLEEDWGMKTQTGYKLLVYLKCGICGEAFPPGTGEIPADMQATVKLQLLAFLLFSTLESVHYLAAAFGGGDSEYALDESAEALLPGPHAALRCLIRLDAGATLNILKQALASWDATESDLADAASIFMAPPSEPFQSTCTATQAVVDALIKIDKAERPQSALAVPTKTGHARVGTARDQTLAYVADFVTAGRATVQLQDAVPILKCLAQHAQDDAHAMHSQEESFVAVLLSAVTGRPESDAEADVVLRSALQLALNAGYLQAQAQVYHSMGNYKQTLQCYLGSESHPEAAFRYIDAAINGGPSVRRVSHSRLPAFKATVMDAMPRLVERDSSATAGIMLSSFPQEHAAAVRQLQGSPNLQYKYLKAALQETAARAEQAADSPSKVAAEAAAVSAHEALLAQNGVGELYVRLLCQFEPDAVLPFLQSHDAYRVEEVLPYTERFGVADAQGYLLERLGDVTSALAIYCDAADRANNELVAAILGGGLPLGSLPIPAQTRLARAGSVQDPSEGQSNLARLFANGTAENRALKESKKANSTAPKLLADAQAALKGAVSLCKRHSRDAAPDAAQELWFTVLQRYVALLRRLRELARQQGSSPAPPDQAQRLAAAQEALTAFMEDIISHMAGYVPLKAIAERILASYASDPFGDFKGTLVGLLAAFSYELSILHTASRLTSADAFRTLHALYRERTHPVALSSSSAAASSTLEGMQDDEVANGASSSSYVGRRQAAGAGMSPVAYPPQAHRLQLLSDINSGGLVVNSRSMGLFLAPAAEKVRSPPPPELASSRPGSRQPGQERIAHTRRSGKLAGSGADLTGPSIEPQSPAHRGGVDINYLRLHDLHL